MNLPMGPQPISLATLNIVPKSQFVSLLGDIVEHSPWVAERAFAGRPFASVEELHVGLMDCVRNASSDEKIALFNRHPELAGKEAVAGVMTENSTSEQRRLGLDRLPPVEFERLDRLNRGYRARFGFPFIAAVRLHHNLDSLMRQFEYRLRNDVASEIDATLNQISAIVFGRLCTMFPAETTR
jgi:2-oxo-4-hydroxy-4-carboxy-5-ureidoimidazoline decarboxylase